MQWQCNIEFNRFSKNREYFPLCQSNTNEIYGIKFVKFKIGDRKQRAYICILTKIILICFWKFRIFYTRQIGYIQVAFEFLKCGDMKFVAPIPASSQKAARSK